MLAYIFRRLLLIIPTLLGILLTNFVIILAAPGGPIHELHVSAQLGEKVLPATGEAPPFRFGYTSEWYANEQRRDMQEGERLQKEGKNPIEIMIATAMNVVPVPGRAASRVAVATRSAATP